MSLSQKNITSFTILNSITNNNADEQKYDINVPFSFIEFLNYAKSLNNTTLNFDQYSIYVKEWNEKIIQRNNSYTVDIKDQFVNLLTEIKLNYTTQEEKRFLSNFDPSKEENLEIIIPFFARKIKEICLYFANKRKTYNKSLNLIPVKGNQISVQETIKDTIISLFDASDEDINISNSKPLSSIILDLSIEIESQYDNFNDYYDLDPTKQPEFYSATGKRKQFFSSNTNTLTPEYFLDQETAITQFIREKGVTLKEVLGLNINTDTTDLSYLDRRDTIDYDEPTRENLKFLLNVELAKNYMGTDFYYLSTNTAGEVLSGSLFSSTKKPQNLLSIFNPSTLTVPSTDLKSEREVGLFFKPTYQGIIRVSSSFDFAIDNTKLEADKIYIFPDPLKYGNITNLTKTNVNLPLIYVLDNKSVFRNISTSFGSNLPKIQNHIQDFTPYSTLEEKNYIPNYTGKFKGIEQFTQTGDIYTKETDIFGNIFVCFSNDSYFTQTVEDNFTGGQPPFFNFSNTTTLYTNDVSNQKETLSFKEQGIKKYFVVDINTQEILPLSGSFSNVFLKYKGNENLYTQLNTSIIELAIFGNCFYIKTLNYVVIDSFTYTDTFTTQGNNPVIVQYNREPTVGEDITFVTNPYRIGNDLFYAVITTKKQSNVKYLIISIYKYDIKINKNYVVINTTTTLESEFENLFTFTDISTNIVKIRQSKFVYNSKGDVYSTITNFVDLNYTPLIHIFNFKIKDNKIVTLTNKYLQPTNDTITENFFTNNVLTTDFDIQTLLSTPTQTQTDGTISF